MNEKRSQHFGKTIKLHKDDIIKCYRVKPIVLIFILDGIISLVVQIV